MNQIVDFYDIYEYYSPPFYQQVWFYVVIGLCLALMVGGIAWWWYRRLSRVMLPWQWALRELGRFTVEKYAHKNDYKKFYFELTSLIKLYLAKRFFWNTQDKTDDELIEYLAAQKFDPYLLEALKKVLQGALLVKFANEEVLKTQAQEDLKIARMIVEKTIPVGDHKK